MENDIEIEGMRLHYEVSIVRTVANEIMAVRVVRNILRVAVNPMKKPS